MLKADNKPSRTLELIDAIQRLGVSYHFESEIDEILGRVHQAYQDSDLCVNENDGLYYISLQFRLFRQNRYRISTGMYFSHLFLVLNILQKSFHLQLCPSLRSKRNKSCSSRTCVMSVSLAFL